MEKTTYRSPVDKLLTYGDCGNFKPWPDYLKLDLTQEHIPELIRMAVDKKLNWADPDSLEIWAPMHAWRVLGQLRAAEAIEPLITLFDELADDDWMPNELPRVYGMIGVEAISLLAKYLSKPSKKNNRTTAVECIEEIGKKNPEGCDKCVSVLSYQLKKFKANSQKLNGFLISGLITLKAVESLSIIESAFEEDRVDYSIAGDLQEVEISLGIRKSRSSPPNYFWVGPLKSKNKKPSLEIIPNPKVGRNDPCPCGSGKKYKKCCLNK